MSRWRGWSACVATTASVSVSGSWSIRGGAPCISTTGMGFSWQFPNRHNAWRFAMRKDMPCPQLGSLSDLPLFPSQHSTGLDRAPCGVQMVLLDITHCLGLSTALSEVSWLSLSLSLALCLSLSLSWSCIAVLHSSNCPIDGPRISTSSNLDAVNQVRYV